MSKKMNRMLQYMFEAYYKELLGRFTVMTSSRLIIGLILGFSILVQSYSVSNSFADVNTGDTRIAKLTADEMAAYEKEKQSKIKEFLKKGIALYEQDKYLEAKAQFERVIRLDPSHPDALSYIKKCDDAIANPQKVVEERARLAAEKKAQEEAIKRAKAEQIAQEKAAREAAERARAEEKARLAEEARLKRAQELAAKKAAEEAAAREMAERKAAEEAAKRAAAEKRAQELAAKKEMELKAKEEEKLREQQISDLLKAGKKNYAQQQYEIAVEQFQKVLELDPNNGEAKSLLEKSQQKLEAILRQEAQALEKQKAKEAAAISAKEQKTRPEKEVVVQKKKQDAEERAYAEKIKRAEAAEAKVRAERAKAELAAKVKEAEAHYQAGLAALNKNDFITAHNEWLTVLSLVPDHRQAKLMIEQTRPEYEKALEEQRKAEELAKQEAENEQRMLAPVITMDVPDQEIGDVLTQMGAVAGFNIIIGEGVKAKVSFSASNWSLKQALDNLLPLYGFKYNRIGNTIQVIPDLKSKVYTLNNDQVRKLHYLMVETRMLQDYLYGKDVKPQIAGQQLYLDERTHQLIITDTKANIAKLDEYITTNLPAVEPRPTELINKTFIIRRGIAEEVRKAVTALLEASPVPGVDITERKVILEPGGTTLVVRDTLDNIRKVEEFLANKNMMDKLAESDLVANAYRVVPRALLADPKDDATEAERKANLRKQMVDGIAEILGAMLYAQEGRDKAYESGRRLIPDEKSGIISVVDTKINQKKVADYIAQLPELEDQPWKIYKIKHAEPNSLLEALRRILQGPGGGGGIGSAPKYTLSQGSGGGVTYGDLYIELVSLTGDTANPSARIYWRTPARDGDQTLTLGQSIQADMYRIRLTKATFNPPQIEIEIWQIQGAQQMQFYQAQQFGQPQGAQLPQRRSMQDIGILDIQQYTPSNALIVWIDRDKPEAWNRFLQAVEQLDIPLLQVSIEAKFIEVNETMAKKYGFDWVIPSLSNIGSLTPVYDQVNFGGSADVLDPLFGTNLIGGNTLYQLQTKGGLSATFQAMEAKGVSKTISSPRVTVINQQSATLSMYKSVPNVTVTWTNSTISYAWSFDSVNISLTVTPTIHEDGSIILNITPTVQEIVGRVPINMVIPDVGLADSPYSKNVLNSEVLGQAVIDTRTLTTQARVNTGETIVLGGLIHERAHTAESKFPILGSIPIIRTFFKKNIDYTETSRLFIFLTATIID
ncbi:MAG: hypothetical protein N3A72_09440 [bacterium]|nr:hypothetical protein [bacterium]